MWKIKTTLKIYRYVSYAAAKKSRHWIMNIKFYCHIIDVYYCTVSLLESVEKQNLALSKSHGSLYFHLAKPENLNLKFGKRLNN